MKIMPGIDLGEYNELLKLKGIRRWKCISNLSRIYGIDIPINIPKGEKVFYEKAKNYTFPVVIGRYLKSVLIKDKIHICIKVVC